jgi:hypothetical protein
MFWCGNDADSDGITDENEYNYGSAYPIETWWGSNPNSVDTDGDLMNDKYEIDNGLQPNNPADDYSDYDNDDMWAIDEYNYGTGHLCLAGDPDSDNDGWYDGIEINLGSNPTSYSSTPFGSPSVNYVTERTTGSASCNGDDNEIHTTNNVGVITAISADGDGKWMWTEDAWGKQNYYYIQAEMRSYQISSISRTYLDNVKIHSVVKYDHNNGGITYTNNLHMTFYSSESHWMQYAIRSGILIETTWWNTFIITSSTNYYIWNDLTSHGGYIRYLKVALWDADKEGAFEDIFICIDELYVRYYWRMTT